MELRCNNPEQNGRSASCSRKRPGFLALELSDALDWRRGRYDDVDRHPAPDREHHRDRKALAAKLSDRGPPTEADIDVFAADRREQPVEGRIGSVLDRNTVFAVNPLIDHHARGDLVQGLREVTDLHFDLRGSGTTGGKDGDSKHTNAEQHRRSSQMFTRSDVHSDDRTLVDQG